MAPRDIFCCEGPQSIEWTDELMTSSGLVHRRPAPHVRSFESATKAYAMIAAGTPGATGLQLSDTTQHTSHRRMVDGNAASGTRIDLVYVIDKQQILRS